MSSSVLEKLNCRLPVGPLPQNLDRENVLSGFQDLLGSLTASAFTSDALWRDTFALTGSIRTFYGAESICEAWQKFTRNSIPKDFTYLPKSSTVMNLGESNWIEGEFTFKIEDAPPRFCRAGVSLVPTENGKWKIWVLRTHLDQLQNHPSVDTLTPVHQIHQKLNGHQEPNGHGELNGHQEINGNGAINGHQGTNGNGTLNGHQETNRNGAVNGNLNPNGHSEARKDPEVFECVVVGAGQAGLSVAGRLQSQGIKYVLIEKNEAVGDSWKNRYRSTKLHTSRESSHLPFNRTFPSDRYPQYLTKYDLAQGYSDWSEKYGINVWVQTTLKSGRWHYDRQNWTLEILKGSEEKTISCTHLIMAIGGGCQIPAMPTYPGQEKFRGVLQHSVDYDYPENWQGKNGIVIGTANTAHDIAEDMCEANMASVTMIQRSHTYVLPAEYYARVQAMTWNAEMPTQTADEVMLIPPIAVGRLIAMMVLNGMAQAEPERFDALEKAGFKLIRYGDIIYQVFDRFGGHYMDVGASAKIAKGLIKMKSNSPPTHFTEDGLVFGDGSELKADVVVFATGFVGTMKGTIRQMLGSEVADSIEDFWGLDDEGELKGAFKPSGHPNFWMHGGTTSHARYMSRFLALQVRAALDGTPLASFSSKKET